MAATGPLKILMITSEASPFAKVGGLGEAVSALASELYRLGHDVRILLPRYYFIDLKKDAAFDFKGSLGIPLGLSEIWTGIYETRLPEADVPVYLLDHELSYGRDGVYGTKFDPFFADNAVRFALLCRASFQLCRMLHWIPDVLHSHDWPTALCNVYLKTLERRTDFSKTAGVFTIHNIGYQGIVPKADMEVIGLSWEHYYSSGLEYYDQINLLQSGIKNADLITAVSPRYAEEILEPNLGYKMDGLLRDRRDSLVGILNGIDYDVWNSETDPLLPHHFSTKDLSGKKQLKNLLQNEVGLPESDKPIVGMVGRLVEQKGFGFLLRGSEGGLYSILQELDLQVIVLGTGEVWCEEELARLAWKFPNLKVILQFNNSLAHLIEAGSDFFLMPSLYEPCGLNQIYSLRYGAIPIVSNTGGLADTVQGYDEATGGGTGFVIDPLNSRNIFETVKKACETAEKRPDHIRNLRLAGMEKRYSWTASAEKYLEHFSKALDKVRTEKV